MSVCVHVCECVCVCAFFGIIPNETADLLFLYMRAIITLSIRQGYWGRTPVCVCVCLCAQLCFSFTKKGEFERQQHLHPVQKPHGGIQEGVKEGIGREGATGSTIPVTP